MKKRLVLCLPMRDNIDSGVRNSGELLPLELLQIATFPAAAGYDIELVDAAIHEDYLERVLEACDGALLFAASCILGYGVYDGARVARAVRERYPDLPIVFGGWWPSVKPEDYLSSGLADVVGIGQGEHTFWEIVQAYENGTSLDEIEGVALWRDGALYKTPKRRAMGFDTIPPVPWELLDYEAYVRNQHGQFDHKLRHTHPTPLKWPGDRKRRGFNYYSSWGCPEPCTFCCSPFVTEKRWKAIGGKVMAEDLLSLQDRFKFDSVRFQDANFGVMEKRSNEFCQTVIEHDSPFFWSATYEIDTIARFKEESCDLLRDANCYLLCMGAEAGTMEQQAAIKKKINIDDNLEIVLSRAGDRGILIGMSWLIGYPNESKESMLATIDLAGKAKAKYPLLSSVVYPFCPIPGAEDYEAAVTDGYKAPQTFEEWGQFLEYKLSAESTGLPPDIVRQYRRYAAFASFRHGKVGGAPEPIRKFMHALSGWRLNSNIFSLPLEIKLFDLYVRMFGGSRPTQYDGV